MMLLAFRLVVFLGLVVHALAQECSTDGKLCDTHQSCALWKEAGECSKNVEYMKKTCPMSCHNNECVDNHENCSFWANKGECSSNPSYMHLECAKSCGTCDIMKRNHESKVKVNKDGINDEENQIVEQTKNFGEVQEVSGAEYRMTLDVILQSVSYMKSVTGEVSESILSECQNRNKLCSFWASLGECEKNEAL